MDWIKENKFLSGFFGMVFLLAVLLGVLCYFAISGYSKTKSDFEELKNTAKGLRSSELFPEEGNLEEKKKQVASYRAQVASLEEDVLKFQRPLNSGITETQFSGKLKDRVLKSKTQATELGIGTYEAFNLGMDKYVSTLPRKAAVPELDFTLDAVDNVCQMLYDARIASIDMITRDEIPPEGKVVKEEASGRGNRGGNSRRRSGGSEKKVEGPKLPESEVINRYPFYVTFTGSMRSVEKFLNSISNTESGEDGSFFYTLRYIRMENEMKEGPAKSNEAEDDLDDDEGGVDSYFILGNEKISMMAAIDVIRFKTAAEAKAEKEAAAKNKEDE